LSSGPFYVTLDYEDMNIGNKLLTSKKLAAKPQKNTISVSRKKEKLLERSEKAGTKGRLTLTVELIVNVDQLCPDVRVIGWELSKL